MGTCEARDGVRVGGKKMDRERKRNQIKVLEGKIAELEIRESQVLGFGDKLLLQRHYAAEAAEHRRQLSSDYQIWGYGD